MMWTEENDTHAAELFKRTGRYFNNNHHTEADMVYVSIVEIR